MTENKILERLNRALLGDGPAEYKRKDFVNEGAFDKNILKSGRVFQYTRNQ